MRQALRDELRSRFDALGSGWTSRKGDTFFTVERMDEVGTVEVGFKRDRVTANAVEFDGFDWVVAGPTRDLRAGDGLVDALRRGDVVPVELGF